MIHFHKPTGQEYSIGTLKDFDNSAFDMIVITRREETGEVKLINFYFGDYNKETTDMLIDQYLSK